MAPKLTLITGPAGSGKTTLIRSWLAGTDRRWSWITVEGSLAHSDQFWIAVVRGVQRAVPDAVFNVADVMGADTVNGHAVAVGLVDDLLPLPTDHPVVVIVIDDAHLLAADTWNDLEWVIAHQPRSLHFVLTSRSDPPFPIARMRTAGAVTEIRQDDLVMSAAETVNMVQLWAGDDVAANIAPALHQRTEGWAAGIRLALLALERGAPLDEVLAPAGLVQGMMAELLVTEALERQPADIRQFLQHTAVANVLEPELCAALTGRSDTRSVLRRLAHDHVFVAPLDGPSDHYRYHPLFAEILRVELRATAADGEADQHRKAALWFQQAGRYADAIGHANAGQHYDLAFDLIVHNLGDLYAQGHRETVARWLLAMPDQFVIADADRAVDHTAALMFLVRPEWLRWIRRARAIVGSDRPDLLARLRLFGALAVAGQGQLVEFEEHVAAAHQLRPAGMTDPFDEVVDAWRSRLLVLHGQLDAAVEVAESVYRRPRRLLRDIPVTGLLAATLYAAGDSVAGDLVTDVVQQWRQLGEPDFMGMADALIVASDLALQRGDTDEAENLAAGAVAVTDERPTHLLGVRAEIALANVEAASGRVDAARTRLRELRERMLINGPAVKLIELIDAAEQHVAARHWTIARHALVDELTERELTILTHLASHQTFPEIGAALFISRHTVKTHVSRIYRKLGVAARSDAVRVATDLALLPAR